MPVIGRRDGDIEVDPDADSVLDDQQDQCGQARLAQARGPSVLPRPVDVAVSSVMGPPYR
jgi:hypothetical protein